MTDPVPAVVPVKVTEQLPPDDKVQPLALNDPPLLPGVNVKVTEPVGMLDAVIVSMTVAVTAAVQLVAPNAILQLTLPILVDVLSLPVTVTVTDEAELVLVLCVVSPPYIAVTEPVPAAVPVNVTEQLVTLDVVDRLQLFESNVPPVNVNVNVTVPVAAFEAVVVSATVAVTDAVQLVPPNAMLQLTVPTLVEVLSLPVTITVTVAAALLLPL